MKNLTFIDKELEKFNVTDSAIAKLNADYSMLTIQGIDDVAGYDAVRTARIVVKGYRVEVEKKRKELIADALDFNRAISKEAKRITDLFTPLESFLSSQENAYKEEKEKIKQAELEAKQARYHLRSMELSALGYSAQDISNFAVSFENYQHTYSFYKVSTDSDHDFNLVIETVKPHFNAWQEYEKLSLEKIAAAAAAQDEAMRINKEKIEAQLQALQDERVRLDAIAREQEAKEDELKAERDAIDKAKWQKEQQVIAKKEAEEAVKAKTLLDEKMKEEKRLRDVKKEDARLARLPDKAKLEIYFDFLFSQSSPDVKSCEASKVLNKFLSELNILLGYFKQDINTI